MSEMLPMIMATFIISPLTPEGGIPTRRWVGF